MQGPAHTEAEAQPLTSGKPKASDDPPGSLLALQNVSPGMTSTPAGLAWSTGSNFKAEDGWTAAEAYLLVNRIWGLILPEPPGTSNF